MINVDMSKHEPYIKKVISSLEICFPGIIEDIEQEMRIACYLNINKPPALTKCIMKRKAIDFIRSYTHWDKENHKAFKKKLSYEWCLEEEMIPGVESGEQEIINKITAEQIINSLSGDEKIIIHDFYHGKELKELGIERNVSDTRICQRKAEILKKLQKRYARAS